MFRNVRESLSDQYKRNVLYTTGMSLLECSQGGQISESLGSSTTFIYQQCDLTLPLSLVLASNREITTTLPTSQGCCEGLV